MVVLSVDDAANADSMRNDFGLEFPVLYDTDHSVTTNWGLFDVLDDGVSVPATFVIRMDGSLESALVGTTISERPTINSILSVLESISGMERTSTDDHDTESNIAHSIIAPHAPLIGGHVPNFDLPRGRGGNVSLIDYAGEQNVVFVFFRSWW